MSSANQLRSEIETLRGTLRGTAEDLAMLEEVWPPSKRGSRAQRHLDNIKMRVFGAEDCVRDALAALSRLEKEG